MKNYTDIIIIGGGINGTAIATDSAGRGLSVTLVEKNDLSAGTSSKSSKLIHGGLRYLEMYEFGLVRKALLEREILLFRAPHLVTPLEFILPHEAHLRPKWMIRAGLFIYDYLAKRNILPGSKSINFKKDIRGKELLPHLKLGFSYYDCFTDDSRLVISNALAAKSKGATILTRTEFLSAERENQTWKVQLKDNLTEKIYYLYSKVLINTAGPWIKKVHNNIKNTELFFDVTLDKGSHIIVPKMYEGDFAYILQNIDQRIIFAIPYLQQFTLIGTTDVPFNGNLDQVNIAHDEEEYLCHVISHYFKKSIQKQDILNSYAGVRCLQASGEHAENISRDYKFLLELKDNTLLFAVIGGKITTHRTLAEDAVNKLKDIFPTLNPSWTKHSHLPGGDIPNQDVATFFSEFQRAYPWIAKDVAYRYVRNYGTRVYELLKNKSKLSDLGANLGGCLYETEVEFLINQEWAVTADDILWRRTKLGLFFNDKDILNLEKWIKEHKHTGVNYGNGTY